MKNGFLFDVTRSTTNSKLFKCDFRWWEKQNAVCCSVSKRSNM